MLFFWFVLFQSFLFVIINEDWSRRLRCKTFSTSHPDFGISIWWKISSSYFYTVPYLSEKGLCSVLDQESRTLSTHNQLRLPPANAPIRYARAVSTSSLHAELTQSFRAVWKRKRCTNKLTLWKHPLLASLYLFVFSSSSGWSVLNRFRVCVQSFLFDGGLPLGLHRGMIWSAWRSSLMHNLGPIRSDERRKKSEETQRYITIHLLKKNII